MMQRYFRVAVAAAVFLLLAQLNAFAQPTPGQATPAGAAAQTLPFVSTIFGDNMVLQRGKPNTIWGWSDPGDIVRVQIGDNTATGTAGPDRRWQVSIQPPAPGGPYTVKIAGHQTLEMHNVLVGDVWLCGGQSNMGLPLQFTKNADDEIKAANHPEIRFFTVQGKPAYHPVNVIAGNWSVLSPETAKSISAVGYYFARKVQQEIHVPIGLVVDAMGGTPAEAWASEASLRPIHDFDVPLDLLDQYRSEGAPEYGDYVMHWYDDYDIGQKANWAAPGFDDSAWKQVPVPGGFAELGVPDTPAVVWFRREITLPDPLPAGKAMLHLGEIERMDTVYINGQWAGASAWVENPRVYPAAGLKPGRNVIAIRVLKINPVGGFFSKPEDLQLVFSDKTGGDKTSIPLAGPWKAMLSVDARPPHPLPISYENWPVMPSVLYEGMLAPIAPLSITGALWYQGEQNSPRGYQYRKILPVMIADWRSLFGQGDFPFYIVSLPAFTQRSPVPVDGDPWTETRESQAIAAASRSQLLPRRHHRHRRPGQHSLQRQAASRRSARFLRTGKTVRQERRLLRPDPRIRRTAARLHPPALHAHRRRLGREGRQAWRVHHRRGRPQMVLGRCRHRRRYCRRFLAFRPQSERSPLCLAVQSRRHALQWRRPARGSIPHRHLAPQDGVRPTLLSAEIDLTVSLLHLPV